MNIKVLRKFIFPFFYSMAILLMIIYQWHEQNSIRQGGSSPIYQNLMECPAYAKRGFDLDFPKPENKEWIRFNSSSFRIKESGLPDLPKRTFLSPFARADEEFTIAIVFKVNKNQLDYLNNDTLAVPGLFISCIGENWEIYLNGNIVRTEMHLDDNGQIKSRRTWRDVYFPMDKTLLTEGINFLTFRIIGDPAYDGTGIYYTMPNYIDDYRAIEAKQHNFLLLLLCGIFGFTGLYYLMLFFLIMKKQEIFNFYYGIFSLLLCGFAIARNGIVNYMLPNSDHSIRLEFFTLFLVVPFICLFIESLGRQKISKVTWIVTGFCFLLGFSQLFFCAQFGQEVLLIWNIIILGYFSYVFVYDVIYYYFWERKKTTDANGAIRKPDSSMGNVLLGSVIVYLCGIYDILDVMFFHNGFNLFIYSCFVFHLGIAFTLSQRFNGMYRQLEQYNTILEKAVNERTLELEQQTKIAINASEVKSRFLATISHEIRTPLNAITGMAELLLRKNLESDVREYALDIKNAGNNLVSIVNDILDISKIEAGKLEIVRANYQLTTLLNDTVRIINIRLKDKPISFITNIDETIPNNLIGDEVRLRQILLNLLNNAVKYTEKGQINFSLIADKWEESDNKKIVWLKITIIDTGIGIKKENLKNLFKEFVQFDTEAHKGIEGTGLGLAIAKQLCNAMGGNISVESEYKKGSAFTVLIPQEIGSAESSDKIEFAATRYNEEDFKIKYIYPDTRILAVDDLPANLKIVEGLLAPYKAVLDVSLSGREAVELVKYKEYDLIFMDHMMPEIDGIEATKQIREYEKEKIENNSLLPIIALTANAVVGMKEMFLENGFNDFLSKPIDIFKLDEILMRWIPENKRIENDNVDLYNGVSFESANLSIPAIPGINLLKGIASTGRNEERYKKVLSVFSLDAQERLPVLQTKPRADSLPVIISTVHSLKGALATIGALELSGQAAALEEDGKNSDFDAVNKKLPMFTEQLSLLIQNINNALGIKNEKQE